MPCYTGQRNMAGWPGGRRVVLDECQILYRWRKAMKRKKVQMIIAGVVLVAVIAGGVFFSVFRKGDGSGGNPDSAVYVDSVAELCGLGSGNGLTDRFAGVVEPQKTWEIELPSDKKVDEILVQEGDEVKAGDKLFTYNTEEMEENLAQAEIDLDRLANEIDQTKEQIVSLKKEKANASADSQLSYTTQINSAENEIKRKEYEQKSKQMEIGKLKNSIANAEVTSEIDGVVKSVNSIENPEVNSMTGEAEPFMTVLATGNFRIKGTVNEQNMSAVIEGQPVIIHSRVDDTTWKGTMTAVDLEKPEKNGGMMYASSDGGTENSSNYPFYVELETAEGLMLGQHVYMEMDHGQDEPKEGMWLDSYYIVQEENDAYVWAATSKDKMEKRSVSLGEFDEELQKYQILDGLAEEDYIAFPDESIQEGDNAVKNIDQAPEMGDMGGMGNSEVPEFDAAPAGGGSDEMVDDEDEPSDEEIYDGDADLGDPGASGGVDAIQDVETIDGSAVFGNGLEEE